MSKIQNHSMTELKPINSLIEHKKRLKLNQKIFSKPHKKKVTRLKMTPNEAKLIQLKFT